MFHCHNIHQHCVCQTRLIKDVLLPVVHYLLYISCKANLYVLNIINTSILTYICSSFGNREVGAHTPGSSVVVPLTAAAVWSCGVMFTLTSQLPLVKHTAVGMQVALAPETER